MPIFCGQPPVFSQAALPAHVSARRHRPHAGWRTCLGARRSPRKLQVQIGCFDGSTGSSKRATDHFRMNHALRDRVSRPVLTNRLSDFRHGSARRIDFPSQPGFDCATAARSLQGPAGFGRAPKSETSAYRPRPSAAARKDDHGAEPRVECLGTLACFHGADMLAYPLS